MIGLITYKKHLSVVKPPAFNGMANSFLYRLSASNSATSAYYQITIKASPPLLGLLNHASVPSLTGVCKHYIQRTLIHIFLYLQYRSCKDDYVSLGCGKVCCTWDKRFYS